MNKRGGRKVELHNYTESIVKEVVDELMNNTSLDICRCERCRLDVAAIALNGLPPHYVVTEKGEVFTRLSFSYNDMRVKVLAAVMNAMLQVARNPSHEPAGESV